MFGAAKVTHLDPSKLDHSPIILSTDGSLPNHRKCRYGFRFEEFWANHEDCEAIIRNAWDKLVIGVPMFQVVHKIKATYYSSGSKLCIRAVKKRLPLSEPTLAQPLMEAAIGEKENLLDRLDILLGQEESY